VCAIRGVERGVLLAAGHLFDRYLPLIQFESQPIIGLGIRKEVLRRRGALATGRTRGLAPTIDLATAAELDDILARLGIVPDIAPFQPAI
jgi:4-hydroxy-tetrahydrodipicolinate synthase